MEATEALLLDYYPLLSQAWKSMYPSGLFSNDKAGINFTALTNKPEILYVRADAGQPACVVNVFDTNGNQLYSIERSNRLSTLWIIYESSTRKQVAHIKCGLLFRSISFSNKAWIHTRKMGSARPLYCGLPDYKFYLTDGAAYEWTRESQFLEKVINPGGGSDETRQRQARVRLLRSKRFDYELLVDPAFDKEVALATAFVSMLTQWSTYHLAIPGARTAIPE